MGYIRRRAKRRERVRKVGRGRERERLVESERETNDFV